MTLVIQPQFQHVVRIMNTNLDGKRNVKYALTAIKGIGRRLADIVVKKANIPNGKRAGECDEDEIEKLVAILSNPKQYKIPNWMLNRQKDIKDGKNRQVVASNLDAKLREDLERLRHIRAHRGLRHYWNLRVRGQHTKTNGRRGKTIGVITKKK